MNPMQRYYSEAISIAETLRTVMVNDLRLQPPAAFYLDANGERVWLIAILDARALGGQITAYTRPQTLHQLSTAAGGRPVLLGNHNGVRYGVLITPRPKLPFPAEYPDDDELADGSIWLGRTLSGTLHPQAARLMNVLVGGEQGSGKSTLLHLFAYAAWKNGWTVYAADPRSMTFDERWNGVLAMPVADKVSDVSDILDILDAEMEQRAARFRATRLSNGMPATSVEAHNSLVGANEQMQRVFVLVDEANTFLADQRLLKRVEDLSRQPRKFGIHFVLAGHNWREADVPRGLSANFHTRISLRVADDTSGRVVLNSPRWGKAMMKVHHPGRAVVFLDGRFARAQFYRLDDERIMQMLMAGSEPAPALTAQERALAERAVMETAGKISRDTLVAWGMTQGQANRLIERWGMRGWASKDAQRANATYITQVLRDLLNSSTTPTTANNRPTAPTSGPTAPTTGPTTPTTAGGAEYGDNMG